MSDDRAAKGRALLEKLTNNPGAIDRFPERFRDYTLEHLFGDVWQGEALALTERSLITCTILTALAREPEQRFHFAAARRLGIPRDKLVEMITHAAHYAGWPNAVGALRSLEDVWPSGE
ncbi:MAG: carboxymuconolactone decarboxylase family protein [Gammaproteobacteria bacterium]|jgi:4-carboxymuconolactone decarboxylase|nr:carboxymuconolactone decarboxylase family protein [Gammaproteobacteria bacterium]